MTGSTFIFGAGFSGRAFAAASPPGTRIAGTTRTPAKAERLREAGILPLVFDGTTVGPDIAAALAEATRLLVSIAPGEAGDPVLAALGDAPWKRMPKLRWAAYLSTVGVYGDHGGAWVDETSACRPVSKRSRLRVAAEEEWRRFGSAAGLPVAVLRLSGIYGPGRNAFVNLEKGTARRLVKAGQVFNRIHVGDIAGALRHLSDRETGGTFNVTDNRPAPPQDVVAHAAALMGIEPPPEIPFETAELTPMARSFYGENKRVSNAAIKSTGFAFRYPDYRSGLGALWAGDWRGAGEEDAASPMRRG